MARGLLLPRPAPPFLGKDKQGLLNSNTSSWQQVSIEGDRCEDGMQGPMAILAVPWPSFPSWKIYSAPPGRLRVHYPQQPRVNKYVAEISVTYCGCLHHGQSNCMAPDWAEEASGAGTSGRELKGAL